MWALLVSHGETWHTESRFCAQTDPWPLAGHWHGGDVELPSWLEQHELPWFWTALKIKEFSPSARPDWGLEALLDIPALASGYSCAVPHPCVRLLARGSQLGGSSCWGHSGHRDRPGVTAPDGARAPQGPRHGLGWQCPQEFCCSPCPASSWIQPFKGVTQNQPAPPKGGSSHPWPRALHARKDHFYYYCNCWCWHLGFVLGWAEKEFLGCLCSVPAPSSVKSFGKCLFLTWTLFPAWKCCRSCAECATGVTAASSLLGSSPASADRRGWHSKNEQKINLKRHQNLLNLEL